MIESKIVSRFNGLKSKLESFNLHLGYSGDMFWIHDADHKTLCVTPTLEGISCYTDAVENMRAESE